MSKNSSNVVYGTLVPDMISVGEIVVLSPKTQYDGVTKRDVPTVIGVLDNPELYGFMSETDYAFLSVSVLTKYGTNAEKQQSLALFYKFDLSEYTVRLAEGAEVYAFAKLVWESRHQIECNGNEKVFSVLNDEYGINIEKMASAVDNNMEYAKSFDIKKGYPQNGTFSPVVSVNHRTEKSLYKVSIDDSVFFVIADNYVEAELAAKMTCPASITGSNMKCELLATENHKLIFANR